MSDRAPCFPGGFGVSLEAVSRQLGALFQEEFPIDDKARLQPEGCYRCNVIDPNSGYEPEQAIIYILRAKVQKRGCFVEGFCHEKSEGAWKCWGTLLPYRALLSGPLSFPREERERRLSEKT